jgi:hypothetical protein
MSADAAMIATANFAGPSLLRRQYCRNELLAISPDLRLIAVTSRYGLGTIGITLAPRRSQYLGFAGHSSA